MANILDEFDNQKNPSSISTGSSAGSKLAVLWFWFQHISQRNLDRFEPNLEYGYKLPISQVWQGAKSILHK